MNVALASSAPELLQEMSDVGAEVTLPLEEADPFDRHGHGGFESQPQLHRVRVRGARHGGLGAVEDAGAGEVRTDTSGPWAAAVAAQVSSAANTAMSNDSMGMTFLGIRTALL